VICSTVSDLPLFETLEQKLQVDVSVSLLAELERELLRLRCELAIDQWNAFCRELPQRGIFQVLRLGSLTLRRIKGSPFSFPADVLDIVMADSFQARPSAAYSAAHLISAWEYSLPSTRSIRARKTHLSREIAEVIRTAVKPRILILGAGQMREAADSIFGTHLQHVEFVALEPDLAASERLRHIYSQHPLTIETGSWNDLASFVPRLGLFDLICSASWLDSTDDAQATAWLGSAVEMLRPGGRILAANFTPGSRDAGWIEACWNWHPFYRSEEDLARLVVELKHPEIRGHAMFRDESGASAFLEIHSI
jgi:hypothetical protein